MKTNNYINENILIILTSYVANENELKEYIEIVSQAISENRKKLEKTDVNYVYYEGHHILPKSLFVEYENDNNNIVLLTPNEHFKCHQLLTKIFPTPEMTFAYLLMSRYHELSSEEYKKMKLEFAIALSEKMTGVPKSEEHKKHISEGRKGLSYGSLSDEHKQKISNSMKWNTPSELNRKICSERCKKRKGNKNTQSKKVRCIEDNLVFDTVHECEQYYNVLHLYRYCSTGKAHSKLNKHFEYL